MVWIGLTILLLIGSIICGQLETLEKKLKQKKTSTIIFNYLKDNEYIIDNYSTYRRSSK